MTLFELPIGKRAIIKNIELNKKVVERLNDLGLRQGKYVVVVRKALFGDPIEIKVGSVYLVVRKYQAEKIEVGL